MQEQFVTLDIAQLMRQKGFDSKCLGYFWRNDFYLSESKNGVSKPPVGYEDLPVIVAPLWQQTLDWLRDVKGIFIDLTLHDRENIETWKYEISEYGFYNMLAQENVYQSYYITRELAIKKALELI